MNKQPVIVGGLVVGILSILPIISFGNCCFCLWALLGGVLTVKLAIDRTAQPFSTSEAAKLASLAGALGAAIYLLGVIILNFSALPGLLTLKLVQSLADLSNNAELQATLQRMAEEVRRQTLAQRLIGAIPLAIIQALFLAGFTVLGGLLGVAIFEKRRGQTPPPPFIPPNYPPPSGPSIPSSPSGEG